MSKSYLLSILPLHKSKDVLVSLFLQFNKPLSDIEMLVEIQNGILGCFGGFNLYEVFI